MTCIFPGCLAFLICTQQECCMRINAIALEEDWLLELRRLEREGFERAVRNVSMKQRGDAFVEAARELAKEMKL